MQIPETARQAAQTWRVLAAYRLAVDGSFEASEDWAAFAAWSREFRAQCRATGWLERARLSDFLRQKIGAGELPAPGEVYVAGFDEMTPQQVEFLNGLAEWRVLEAPDHSAAVERRRLRDSSQEIRNAAAWARRLLEADPRTQIGIIVVPDLTRSRSAVERIFRPVARSRISPLRRTAARAIIPWFAPLCSCWNSRSALCHCRGRECCCARRFSAQPKRNGSQRALLDAKLRSHGHWDISIPLLRDAAKVVRNSSACCDASRTSFRSLTAEQAPSEWIRDVAGLLDAFGWPGDRTPASGEFQTIEAWRDLLSNLASLDLTAPPAGFSQIVDWLHESAANEPFQVEDEGAPVQVMGMLEASGLRFDHLWIMGLHDEALPAPANPNPFIPSALQRQHNLPHCSAGRELEFDGKLMERLLRERARYRAELSGTRGRSHARAEPAGRWRRVVASGRATR